MNSMSEIFNTIFKYKEKQSPDKLGLYPERVHVEAMPERRYLWASRVLVILSCLSISLNMMLAATIYLLLPQRTVYPRLFQINKYFSMLEQVQPAEINFPVSDLITEEHITEYIARDVYDDFAKNDVQNNIMQFREKSLQRDVEIEWIKPLAKGLWQVQFKTLDYLPEYDYPVINIWRATLRISYVKIPFIRRDDGVLNPYGFLVNNFSLAYHGTPETSAHYLETAKKVTEELYK